MKRASQNRPMRHMQDPRELIYPSKGNNLLRSRSKDAEASKKPTAQAQCGNWEPRQSYGLAIFSD